MLRLAYPYGTPDTRAPVLGFQGAPADVLPRLADLGYTGVELFVRDPDEMDRRELEAALAQSELTVVQIGTGPVVKDDGLTFTDPDLQVRRAAVQRGKTIARMAVELGSHMNAGSLRGNIDPERPEESRRWMGQALEEVCEAADAAGGRVVLEPQNRRVVNNLNSVEEAVDFLDALAIPNLFLMLDVFHVLTEGQSLADALAAAGDRIIHMHVADRDRACPGQGDFDLRAALRQLKAFKHPGHITVEILQEPTSEAAARAARDHLTALWSEF